jgi:hypothetical protein
MRVWEHALTYKFIRNLRYKIRYQKREDTAKDHGILLALYV